MDILMGDSLSNSIRRSQYSTPFHQIDFFAYQLYQCAISYLASETIISLSASHQLAFRDTIAVIRAITVARIIAHLIRPHCICFFAKRVDSLSIIHAWKWNAGYLFTQCLTQRLPAILHVEEHQTIFRHSLL